MKNLSGQESLWVAFPILVVLILLIAGLIFLPRIQTEIRSRASEPAPTIITPIPTQARTEAPEIVCSELYNPVCGADGVTYSSGCEANLAGVTNYVDGQCLTPTPTRSPAVRYILPTTNQ